MGEWRKPVGAAVDDSPLASAEFEPTIVEATDGDAT
jgi:hypothetical protein